MQRTSKVNADIQAVLASLNIKHETWNDVIYVSRTSMVNAWPYRNEADAYAATLKEVRRIALPSEAYACWEGHADDWLAIGVYE